MKNLKKWNKQLVLFSLLGSVYLPATTVTCQVPENIVINVNGDYGDDDCDDDDDCGDCCGGYYDFWYW